MLVESLEQACVRTQRAPPICPRRPARAGPRLLSARPQRPERAPARGAAARASAARGAPRAQPRGQEAAGRGAHQARAGAAGHGLGGARVGVRLQVVQVGSVHARKESVRRFSTGAGAVFGRRGAQAAPHIDVHARAACRARAGRWVWARRSGGRGGRGRRRLLCTAGRGPAAPLAGRGGPARRGARAGRRLAARGDRRGGVAEGGSALRWRSAPVPAGTPTREPATSMAVVPSTAQSSSARRPPPRRQRAGARSPNRGSSA